MENSLAWRTEPAESVESATLFLEHLDAAHNLARWLLRDSAEAEDAVQDAFLRAVRYFNRFRGGDGRAWLLAIVRNCCYDRLRDHGRGNDTVFDEQLHSSSIATPDPEASSLREQRIDEVSRALKKLPPHFCEILVLREFEDMSYSQIAAVAQIPLGTVMSRLNRARRQLRETILADRTLPAAEIFSSRKNALPLDSQ